MSKVFNDLPYEMRECIAEKNTNNIVDYLNGCEAMNVNPRKKIIDSIELKKNNKLKLKKNKWGRYEEKETHIVFDTYIKAAYGVQDHKTGKVLPLTDKHEIICQKYGWPYELFDEIEESNSNSSDDE